MRRYECLSRLLICAFAIHFSVISAHADENGAKQAYENAHKYEESGNFQQARKAYEKALQSFPDSEPIRSGLIFSWTKLIEQEPKEPKNYIERGKVYQRFGMLEAAEEEYKRALAYSPGNKNEQASRLLDEISTAKQLAEDTKRFELQKQQREASNRALRESKATVYLSQIKSRLEKVWLPPAHTGLLITKRQIVLDLNGKTTARKVLTDCANRVQNSSVDKLLDDFEFSALPKELETLEITLSFMSDGTTNIVEATTPLVKRTYSATAAAPTRPSVSKQPDVDFGPYMADLQRRIKRAWFPPKGEEGKRIVVVFKVHTGGEITDIRIDHSSGSPTADEAGLSALRKASPARPLPPQAPPSVDVQYTFDYNVYAGGGRGTFRQF